MTATVKFSQLPNLTTIQANTTIPVVDTGNNYTVTTAALQTFVNSTTGNVTASYFIGNGSQLTGLPAVYSNANVAAFLPVYSGNINAAYYYGDGSGLTGITVGNSNTSLALANNTSAIQLFTGANGPYWSVSVSGVGNILNIDSGNVNLNKKVNIISPNGLNVGGDTNFVNGNVSIVAGSICNIAQPTTFYNANVSVTYSATNYCFLKITTITSSAIRSKTGAIGQIASITDSASVGGKAANGMMAYWDTTNTRWSYVSDNTAV